MDNEYILSLICGISFVMLTITCVCTLFIWWNMPNYSTKSNYVIIHDPCNYAVGFDTNNKPHIVTER